MKRILGKGSALLVAFVIFLVIFWAGVTPPVSVSAATDEGYVIHHYGVTMDVAANRKINVVENLFVEYFERSHGFVRDFPLEKGVRYTNIKALRDGADVYTFTQMDDSSFLSVYIGSTSTYLNKGQDYLYTISYTMTVPAMSEEGYLPLDVIGYDWTARIESVTAVITFPDGLVDFEIYSGYAGTVNNDAGVTFDRLENAITLNADYLGLGGITLDLSFAAGVLTTSFDMNYLWMVLLALGAAAVAVLLKVCLCRQPLIVRSVSLEAPDEMDPLRMGAIIDNKVDSEDMGALVFWMASEGYLTIDMTENDEDPTLCLASPVPSEAPAWQKTFFEGLFHGRETVRPSQLNQKFYTTADSVKKSVTAANGKLYENRGYAIAILICALCALLFGGFAFFASLGVTARYYYWGLIPVCFVCAILPAVITAIAFQRSFKWKKAWRILATVGGFLLGTVVGLLTWLFPSAAFPTLIGFLFAVFSAAIGTVAGMCGVRTKEYSEKLGRVLGFKDFILYTERDKIEFMLKENPELYYRILPYAQVLGVTNAWTEKFKGLDMKAPNYVTHSSGDFVINCMIYNSLFHSLNRNLAHNIVSRPTNSGSHGVGGGHGHGFGGGGFGGGGGRRF